MPSVMIPDGYTIANGGGFIPINQAPQYAQPQQAPQPAQHAMQNPFTSAMSGTQNGTLQDYINRMMMQANQAQGGGLLGFNPQQYQAGNAGGQPTMGMLPQTQMPLSSFGQRSWMK